MPPELSLAAWTPLLPGIAFWALALFPPLTLALDRLEGVLAAGPLDGLSQQVLLVACGLLLSLLGGLISELALGWALGPGWASSLGLVAALWGLFWSLAASSRNSDDD